MNSRNFIYRPSCPADLNQIQQLGLLAYSQHTAELTPDNATKLIERMSDIQFFKDLMATSTGFVCEYENNIIGMAFLVPHGNPTSLFLAEWSYIRMVGVHPDFGGQGIGRKVTEMCVAFARKTNEKTIALHTSEFMHAARHIYESMGFQIHHEIEPLLGRRYWIYTLEL